MKATYLRRSCRLLSLPDTIDDLVELISTAALRREGCQDMDRTLSWREYSAAVQYLMTQAVQGLESHVCIPVPVDYIRGERSIPGDWAKLVEYISRIDPLLVEEGE